MSWPARAESVARPLEARPWWWGKVPSKRFRLLATVSRLPLGLLVSAAAFHIAHRERTHGVTGEISSWVTPATRTNESPRAWEPRLEDLDEVTFYLSLPELEPGPDEDEHATHPSRGLEAVP